VVISGASTGIGRSCALHLDRLGFHVFAGVRRAADAHALTQVASPRLTPIVLDITDPGAVAAARQAVSDRNLAMTQAFLPLLRRSRGRIVNISSLAGRLAVPVMGSYTAAKHALEGLSGSLRLELATSGVRVSVVEPGDIQTSMSGKLHRDVTAALSTLPDDGVRRYSALVRGVEVAIGAGAEGGAPPAVVAEAVAHALTSHRPRIRYQVGPRSRRMTLLARLLPDRLLDSVLQRTFEPRPRTTTASPTIPAAMSTPGPYPTKRKDTSNDVNDMAR
jgi:NAD(P)-dependent dehydrogenase (short-subunit alcohol dehydrogenase family)